MIRKIRDQINKSQINKSQFTDPRGSERDPFPIRNPSRNDNNRR
jgi:hypothetical protein